jgi:TIR domain
VGTAEVEPQLQVQQIARVDSPIQQRMTNAGQQDRANSSSLTPSIFISYRHDDSVGDASHLCDNLRAHFGSSEVFLDIDTIPPGTDWPDVIQRVLDTCKVLIALIGKSWLNMKSPAGERYLDDPEDWVRREIAAALDRNITVFPILVQGASRPRKDDLPDALKALDRKEAMEISYRSWDSDVTQLVGLLVGEVAQVGPVEAPPVVQVGPVQAPPGVRQGITCLVTIHGINFQQPPLDGVPGYADALHQSLSHHLGLAILSDNPLRERSQPGEAGPIYVLSNWPPSSRLSGLSRLGEWDASKQEVDISNAPLLQGTQPIAHVALVYTLLEDAIRGAKIRARPIFFDWAKKRRLRLSHSAREVMKALEADAYAYAFKADLRERVRVFIRDALLRLAGRDDVATIVVNAHSQGTVMAFDVLRDLPPSVAKKVSAFVTAGSPLAKYIRLLSWTTDVGSLEARWTNFWDYADPVADPLSEIPGRPPLLHVDPILSVDPGTERTRRVAVDDRQVDNVAWSRGGGLRAHNYWDNDPQVISPLAAILAQAIPQSAVIEASDRSHDYSGAICWCGGGPGIHGGQSR